MKALILIISIISLITLGFDRQVTSNKPTNLKRNQVQRIYTAELGVKEETGSNDGPRVEEYLRHVRLKKGDPWCAAFVCWVFDQAGVANPRTGWSPGLFPKGKVIWERGGKVEGWKVEGRKVEGWKGEGGNGAAGKGVAGKGLSVAGRKGIGGAVRSLPQRGDVFGIWFPEKGRIAHVGFVDHWSDKWLITVEGNTNEAGSREGDGVLRKRRLVASVYQVSDFISRP